MKQVSIFIALLGLATLAIAAPQGNINNLLKLTSKSLQCEGTECPAGCCPNVGWFCCPDDLYCAATAADCPMRNTIHKIIKLATKNTPKQCEGTECPAGCCPNVGWFCCPDDLYCAATAADCPMRSTIHKIIKLATKNTPKQCEGTECPAGCCPNVGWFCCPDDLYCAATAADCPMRSTIHKIIKLATKNTPKQCEGTECPAGCCPNVGWFCCPDDLYCAATAADCPAKKTIKFL